MPSTLINVSNRLPVTVQEDQITKSSGGLVAALDGLPEEQFKTKWIGWPGAAFPEKDRQREIEQKLSEEYGCVPVFLGEEEATGFYEGFSNSSIWLLLHYLPNFLRYEPAWWEHYQNVNRTFAKKVLEVAQEGDLVWVHDYQLMLVPAMLRAVAPDLKIGFFSHTPFPAYEIFRCHPRRSELIAGMLGANRIGFHAFGYLRHFSSTVQRLLGVETGLTHIANEQHIAALGVYPIGINACKFQDTLDSKEFHQRQVQEVESRVGQLNGKYATLVDSPIHFVHASVPFVDLCALYALADAALITPLVDGMNLVAKEFIACQQEKGGSLILSEFAGAAEELFNAFLVNPYDSEAVAETLKGALALPEGERRERIRPMREQVLRYDAEHWVRSFIDDLVSGDVKDARTAKGDIKEIRKVVE